MGECLLKVTLFHVFFTIFKLNKWYQTAQRITNGDYSWKESYAWTLTL